MTQAKFAKTYTSANAYRDIHAAIGGWIEESLTDGLESGDAEEIDGLMALAGRLREIEVLLVTKASKTTVVQDDAILCGAGGYTPEM